MIGRGTSFVGLALAADGTIACAEVSVVGGRAMVHHAATFSFLQGTSMDAPGPAGQALAGFLRQNKFGSARAVVGVPARWLVAMEKELPPADDATAQSALRLQAERLAIAESGEMVFDFAGKTSRDAISKVLLVGMHRKQLDQVQKLLDAAGLTIVAVTSTSLAISTAASSDELSSGVLTLNRGGAELVWRSSGSPRMLRHLPMSINGNDAPATGAMTTELRRIVALTGSNGTSGARSLVLVDGVGLDDQQVADLSGKLGVSVKSKSPRELLGVESMLPAGAESAPAIALALVAAKDELPLDFEHSRLTPAPPRRFGRRAIVSMVCGAIALAVLVWLLVAGSQRQSKLDSIQSQLTSKQKDIEAARAVRDRLKIGSGYFQEGRPSAIDCLREITQVFGVNEKIWATNLTFHENGKCVLSGKSADQQTVLRVLDALKKTGKFADVHLQDMREADTRSGEETFSIGFTYNGVR